MSAKRSLDLESSASTSDPLKTPEKKIKIDEPLSPHTETGAATKIDFCALVTAISPMKNKLFIGELVDEQKCIRFVGFDQGQKMQLDALYAKKQPVLLKHCDIQVGKYSKSLEVVIKGYTKISKSTNEFNIHHGRERDIRDLWGDSNRPTPS